MGLFRERLLARLVDSHAVSAELVSRLVSWNHPGFSAHVGEPIEPGRKQLLEDTAAYLVRTPRSLKKLVYLDGERAVIYRSRLNPRWAGTSRRWAAPHALLRRVLEPRQGLR